MNKLSTGAETRCGRVALLGRPNVGKSTLLNALLREPLAIVSAHPQTTREPVRGVLTRNGAQLVLVDTPGVHVPRTRLGEWMNAVTIQAAHDADVIVLVIDAAGRGSIQDDLAIASDLPRRPVVIALTKVDCLGDKARLLPLMAAVSERGGFTAAVPLSAKRNDGLDRLVAEIVPCLPEQPMFFAPDTLSDQPQRFFVAELVREQIILHTWQEVPHGVAVVIERFDETTKPLRIEASVAVAREAHKKILVGAGGRTVKAIGTAARARIERLLGVGVRLELRVRAAPGWPDDRAQLRELGYGRPEDLT